MKAVKRSLFSGRVSASQRKGMATKWKAFDAHGISDPRWRAYMMATSYHETGGAMIPVEEMGRGKGKPYGWKRKQNGSIYVRPDKIYYGRGDVQLTWYENYERMGNVLGMPLLEQPELMLDGDVSARVLIEGMTRGISGRGDFTGAALEDYFNDRVEDPLNARRIVNGMDRADRIAVYYKKFLAAMRVIVLGAVLLVSGCRPARGVSEQRVARVDSTAVLERVDSLHRECKTNAVEVTGAELWREESVRFTGERHERVIRYDTSLPVDSATGRPPLQSESVSLVRGEYHRAAEDEMAGHTAEVTAHEGVSTGRSALHQAVEHQSAVDEAAEVPPPKPRRAPWVLFMGIGVGLAIAVVLTRLFRKKWL